jgi:hypothetical protein
MKLTPWLSAAMTLALSSAAWAQQDTIKMREGGGQAPEGIKIVKVTCKELSFEYLASPGVPQTLAMDKIANWEIEQNRKPNDLLRGEDLIRRQEYRDALDPLNRVRGDSKVDAVIQDIARRTIIEAYAGLGDPAKLGDVIDSLRKESPEGYWIVEGYKTLADLAKQRGDTKTLEKAKNDLDAAGKSLGMKEWSQAAELISASVLEAQGKHKEAAAVYRKFAGDQKSDVGIDANLGMMRCLSAAQDWPSLKAKTDDILGATKGKDPRLLQGAYVGRGDVLLNQDKKNKEALLEFLRAADVMSAKIGEATTAHEIALAHAAIAAARFATETKDPDQKATYKGRAQELLGEAQKRFGDSAHTKAAAEEIKNVK